MGKYYITTTAPYVNAEPHIGFALEIIQADVLARLHSLGGDQVFFNAGTDEHGKKIWEAAEKNKVEVNEYVAKYAAQFAQLKELLNLSDDLTFFRTTDERHIRAAQEMWRRVKKAGYIRKGVYRAKYCVGCELEKQDSELVEGKCPLHPNKEIEFIEEENYFFEFAKLAPNLMKLYRENPQFVVPSNRLKEIKKFVEAGVNDFSISRLASKMPWGVPVPDDSEHVMYVWFDALTYYISALGWPDNKEVFEQYWGTNDVPNAVQVAGKDNLRQQTAMWQAMLMAAKLPTSKQIMIHGFITSNGQKMSKSLGNVINPVEYVTKYGASALRYYLLAKLDPWEDSDFTVEKFENSYQADLANGLGNLVARVAAMAKIFKFEVKTKNEISQEVVEKINLYRFDEALKIIWERIAKCDRLISEKRVWEQSNEDKYLSLTKLVDEIRQIALDLSPFMPETAKKIQQQYGEPEIKPTTPLFPRLK